MCLAIPGRVVEIGADPLRTAQIAFGTVSKEVSLALVPEAVAGDYVIVHAGMALQVIDEAAAQEILAAVSELEAAEDTLTDEPARAERPADE